MIFLIFVGFYLKNADLVLQTSYYALCYSL